MKRTGRDTKKPGATQLGHEVRITGASECGDLNQRSVEINTGELIWVLCANKMAATRGPPQTWRMTVPNQPDADDQLTRRKFVRGGTVASGLAAAGVFGQVGKPAEAAQAGGRNRDLSKRNTEPDVRADDSARLFSTSGVIPSLAVSADLAGKRSESGIGAVVPWAGRLWLISYVAHTQSTGSGTGLFEIDEELNLTKRPESVVGTYANRLVHPDSLQLIIGPHIIDAKGKVRTFDSLVDHRLTATMTHLKNSKNQVYFLTMEGLLFEADVHSLKTRQLFNLNKELSLPPDAYAHYKGGYTSKDRVVVANNTYSEKDEQGLSTGGRLAEWRDGKWSILERTAFNEVTGRPSPAHAELLATGWDRASAILKVLADGEWRTYRLPKASHCYDHMWYTEWPRIREVETERLLMDCHGMFYELSPLAYGGHVWGVKPVSQHLRMVPDFCSWRGFLVLAGNQVTTVGGNLQVGEPQSNLWFGKTDDLWQFGKPQGWGGPWLDTLVEPGKPSDPYLMTGFDKKVLHLSHDSEDAQSFELQIDFLGIQKWHTLTRIDVDAQGYAHYEFPAGFSAHWVRIVPGGECTATAQFVYS